MFALMVMQVMRMLIAVVLICGGTVVAQDEEREIYQVNNYAQALIGVGENNRENCYYMSKALKLFAF